MNYLSYRKRPSWYLKVYLLQTSGIINNKLVSEEKVLCEEKLEGKQAVKPTSLLNIQGLLKSFQLIFSSGGKLISCLLFLIAYHLLY